MNVRAFRVLALVFANLGLCFTAISLVVSGEFLEAGSNLLCAAAVAGVIVSMTLEEDR